MAYNSAHTWKTGKRQGALPFILDDDSDTSDPCHNKVENNERRKKRKNSHDEEPLKKRQRGAEESPNKTMGTIRNVIIISSKSSSREAGKARVSSSYRTPAPKWDDDSVISCTSLSLDEKEMHHLPFPVKTSRDEFKTNYIELFKIGEGGFGVVYAGYRKADATPVAIKYVPKERVKYTKVVQNGKVYQVVKEVELMAKAAGGGQPCGRSAAIALLDCFDLKEDFIFIMERPVPCVDLYDYRRAQGGYLKEDKAKIILRQIVDAAIEIHLRGVFHRDIKVENILIEPGRDVPRVRLIDFGCGCFVRNNSYRYFRGTQSFAPPEWFLMNEYKAIPTTVWQLGALLYNLLDHNRTFSTEGYLYVGAEFNSSLSKECLNFLDLCLTEDPEKRATLEMLQLHPWLK